VLVEVDGGPRCVRVRLSDEAPAFDPVDAPAPDLESPLEERDPGGLGWHLVHQLMDEVEHKPAPPRGNTYTLVKQLSAPAPEV
jgi:serine/threonine-protein kinase RsbW